MNMFVKGAINDHYLNVNNYDAEERIGAELIFSGIVRSDKHSDSKVTGIEFTAQEKMSEQIYLEILSECKDQFNIANAMALHSLGYVAAGDRCFLVIIGSKHRLKGYAALQFVVDEIKKRCPIFGKEILDNGNYTWKKNNVGA